MGLKLNTKFWTQGAVIAAVYAGLTMALAPISYGMMQVRLAEALTVLPALTPAAIPGLFVGCLVANLLSPIGIIDIVFGSFASLIAAVLTYKLRSYDSLIPLPPVAVNAVIVGAMLKILYVPEVSLLACMGWVALGQLISCYAIGLPLLKLLRKYEGFFKCDKDV